MPTLIYDIMRVMFALTGPAAFICLVNAGIALRKEGGTVFWIGGGFSRWMLWTVIFLELEPTLVWFQFLASRYFSRLELRSATVGFPESRRALRRSSTIS